MQASRSSANSATCGGGGVQRAAAATRTKPRGVPHLHRQPRHMHQPRPAHRWPCSPHVCAWVLLLVGMLANSAMGAGASAADADISAPRASLHRSHDDRARRQAADELQPSGPPQDLADGPKATHRAAVERAVDDAGAMQLHASSKPAQGARASARDAPHVAASQGPTPQAGATGTAISTTKLPTALNAARGTRTNRNGHAELRDATQSATSGSGNAVRSSHARAQLPRQTITSATTASQDFAQAMREHSKSFVEVQTVQKPAPLGVTITAGSDSPAKQLLQPHKRQDATQPAGHGSGKTARNGHAAEQQLPQRTSTASTAGHAFLQGLESTTAAATQVPQTGMEQTPRQGHAAAYSGRHGSAMDSSFAVARSRRQSKGGHKFRDSAALKDAFGNSGRNIASSVARFGPVNSWGTSSVTSMSWMFHNTGTFNQRLDSWDTSSVKTMSYMFNGAVAFNQGLDSWDTSSVANMDRMFPHAKEFNQPLDSWNTSSVTIMSSMFCGAVAFNQTLDSWNTSSVTTTSYMFSGAVAFNQGLDSWDTSSVKTMFYMFRDAKAFNQALDSWDTSSVTSMGHFHQRHPLYDKGMFQNTNFNHPIDSWDTASVKNMYYMFGGADAFNQALDSWGTSSVTDMQYMFLNAKAFNQGLDSWDTSSVKTMSYMFRDAGAFNQALDSWVTSSVTTMHYMFRDAARFNQPLNSWNTSSVTSMSSMFHNAKAFKGDLTRWAEINPKKQGWANQPADYCTGALHLALYPDKHGNPESVCRSALDLKVATLADGSRDWAAVADALTNATGTTRLYNYSNPASAPPLVFVGKRYVLAPKRLDANKTVVDTHNLDDITYRLGNASKAGGSDGRGTGMQPSIDCETGVVTVEFSEVGNFSIDTIAKGPRGTTDVLETLNFTVAPAPTFAIAVNTTARTKSGAQFTDPSAMQPAGETPYYAGDPYRIAPHPLIANQTIVPGSRTFADIRYTIEGPDAAVVDQWFVGAQNGDIYGSFTSGSAGSVQNISLYAVDGAGGKQLVETYLFGVETKPAAPSLLTVEPGWGYNSTFEGRDYVNVTGQRNSSHTFAVGGTYTFPPIDIDSPSFASRAGDTKATSTTTFTLRDAPPGFLIDPSTALSTFSPTSNMSFTAHLIAQDSVSGLVSKYLHDYTITVKYRDTDIPENGPGGSDCSSTGTREKIDGTAFDGNFTCACHSLYEGSNCETAKELAGPEPLTVFLGWEYDTDYGGRDYVNTSKPTHTLAFGSTYSFPPINGSTFKSDAGKGLEAITFTLTGAPPGFLIDPRNGFVQGVPSASTSQQGEVTHTMQLWATDVGTGQRTKEPLANYSLTTKYKDTANPDNGPGGKKCFAETEQQDDVKFDGNYTCNCQPPFAGPTCELAVCNAEGLGPFPRANYSAAMCQPASKDAAADPESTGTATVAALIAALVLAAVLLIGWVGVGRLQAHKRATMATDFAEQLAKLQEDGVIDAGQASSHRVPRELKRSWLTLVELLGHGAFGEVWKGLLSDGGNPGVPEYMVAAKSVRDRDGSKPAPAGGDATAAAAAAAVAEKELQTEALLMAQVGSHTNLVSIIGVITRGTPKVLVLSYCEHGELLGQLKRRSASGKAFSLQEKYQFCSEIAAGMAHLAAHKLVHRDLAARNVLLATAMVCKVADFGLSRRVETEDNASDYYKSANGMIPVRWTAPEGLTAHKFSTSSDVWSFGIVCVEIFQDGLSPYVNTRSLPALMALVTGGAVHPRPSGCSKQVYGMLVKCWSFEPEARPGFEDVAQFFEGLVAVQKRKQGGGSSDSEPHAVFGVADAISDEGYDMPTSVVNDAISDEGYDMPTSVMQHMQLQRGSGGDVHTYEYSNGELHAHQAAGREPPPGPYGSSRKIAETAFSVPDGAATATDQMYVLASATGASAPVNGVYGRYVEGEEADALLRRVGLGPQPVADDGWPWQSDERSDAGALLRRGGQGPPGAVPPAASNWRELRKPSAKKLYGVVPRTGMTPTEYLPIGKMNPPPRPSAAVLAAAARRQAETKPHGVGTGHAAAADGAFDAAIGALEAAHPDAANDAGAAATTGGGSAQLDEFDDSDVNL